MKMFKHSNSREQLIPAKSKIKTAILAPSGRYSKKSGSSWAIK